MSNNRGEALALKLVLAAAMTLLGPFAAGAATGTWTNGLSGGLWSAATNWSGGIVADGSGATADFNTVNLTTDPTRVQLDSARTLGNLVIGDTTISSAAGWILDDTGVQANVLTLAGPTPTITVNALGAGKAATLSAGLAGTAGWTKSGSGTLVLAGSNTNTGLVTISAGMLKLGAAGALGDGVNNASGLTVGGSGILDLAGVAPTADVPLTLNSTASGFDVGAFYNSGAAAAFAGAVTLGRPTRVGAGNIILTGVITGGGFNLVKDGVNTLELTNSGTVTLGALQANRGTLQVDTGTTLNVTSINVGSGNNVGAGLTLSGGSVNCSGLTQFGTGLGVASGTLNLNGGTLTVTNLAKGAVTFNLTFNGGTLRAGAANPAFLTNASSVKVLAGGAVIDDGGFAITIAPPLTDPNATGGGLTKLGGGTLTLGGTNTFTGPTLINAGTLALQDQASLPVTPLIFVQSNATFDVSGLSNPFGLTAGQVLANAPASTARLAGNLHADGGALALNFQSPKPSFTVTNGTLTISAGTVITINNRGAQLTAGSYKLIAKAATGNVGTVTGSFPSWVTVGGAGAAGLATLQLTNGELYLSIASPSGSKVWNGPAGGDLATAGNWMPTGVPADNTIATFSNNALNTAGLFVNGALPSGTPLYGVLLNITQTNRLKVTVNTGPRLSGVIVNAGAGAVTFTNGAADSLLWSGNNANITVPLVNDSTNPVMFAAGLRMVIGGGSTYTKTLSFSGAGDWLVNGLLGSPTGAHLAIAKSGLGTLTLGGAATNSFDGDVTVNNGTLRLLAGDVLTNTPGVTLRPGAVLEVSAVPGGFHFFSGQTLEGNGVNQGNVIIDPGATVQPDLDHSPLTFSNNLALAGTLLFNVNRTNLPNAGKIVVAQTLTNGGTLKVMNLGSRLQIGDAFDLLDVATNQGAFAQVLLPPLIYGLRWNTNQLASAGIIKVETNSSLVAPTITLNPATTYQQIHGIGANFCLGPQSIAWNNSQFNLAFSPTNLNLSFVRLANSFECALDEPGIFWSGWDSDNVRFIEMYRAKQTNGLITLSAWSPPGRFKSTGSAMGGTLAKTNSAYRYADYADWWLRSLQYLRDNSSLPVAEAIPDYISIQNEADFTPSGTFYAAWQAGCYLASTESGTKAGYPQALAAVKKAFQTNGFGFVKFIGPDTTTASPSTISSYLNNLPGGSLAAIAHHPYQGSVNDLGHVTGSLSGLRAAYPNSTLYMTEFFGDDSYGTNVPAWMMHGLPMHNVFTLEQANTYLMWGLSVSPASATYCALGHYSKFINPGDRRANVTSSDPNLLVSLYRHTNSPGISDRLVLVIINSASTHSYPVIVTSNYWASDPLQRTWKLYLTGDDGSASYRLTLLENESGSGLVGNRNLVLPPYSMATAILNTGISSNAPPAFTSVASNRVLNAGQTLVITNTATDPNQPAQTLAFALPVKPAGATIQAPSGILTWRPLIAQAGATYPFSVVVSDSASPSLSATQHFTVTIRPVTSPVISSATLTNGQCCLLITGDPGPDYTVQASTNLATWTSLFTANSPVLPLGWADTNAVNFSRRFYRVLLGP